MISIFIGIIGIFFLVLGSFFIRNAKTGTQSQFAIIVAMFGFLILAIGSLVRVAGH